MKKLFVTRSEWRIIDEAFAAKLLAAEVESVLVIDIDEILASLYPDGIEVSKRIERALSEIKLIRDSLVYDAEDDSPQSQIKQAKADGYTEALRIIQQAMG